jgi:hypothetical protein
MNQSSPFDISPPSNILTPSFQPFTIISEFDLVIMAGKTFEQRVLATGCEVMEDITEKNFSLEKWIMNLSANYRSRMATARINRNGMGKITDKALLVGAEEMGYRHAGVAEHLSATAEIDEIGKDVAAVSLNAVALNWRGIDCKRSFLGTVPYERRTLTNFLWEGERRWDDKTIFLLIKLLK